MIVFDLQCTGHGHVFEAWFSSSSSFADQKAGGLLMCPTCGASDVIKAVMAPNVPTKSNQRTSAPQPVMSDAKLENDPQIKEMMGKIASIQAEALKDSLWVGSDFEKQARAMDAGETKQTAIHGQATIEQARDMVEDGIALMPLLVPIIPPEQQN